MTKKPTYEKLEQRIKELERIVDEGGQMKAARPEREKKHQAPLENSEDKTIAQDEIGQIQTQLHQSLLMEYMGTLAGGIAHNINNFFMGIQGNASLMLTELDSKHPHYEKLKNIERYVQDGADLTKRLLDFARGEKYEAAPADLNEIIGKSLEVFGKTKNEIIIHSKYQKDIWMVDVDQGQIEHALLTLYVNAWQAMSGRGELYLQTENVTLDENTAKQYLIEPGGYVKTSLTYAGEGLDLETKQKMFDPFFTNGELDISSKLELASVYGIVKNHGGTITVHSEKGEGTTFNIQLPISEKEFVQEIEFAEVLSKGSETVLLVDDEEMIIDVGRQMLAKLGYEVLTAKDGKEALEIYKKNKDKIDIVILDVIMPGMSGGETYDELKKNNFDVKVLLASGYGINRQINEILERGCNGFIQKPFNMKQLSRKIREILEPISKTI